MKRTIPLTENSPPVILATPEISLPSFFHSGQFWNSVGSFVEVCCGDFLACKNKLFSDINKYNIITRSNRPMKQFQQCVSSLDSVTLLKIDFKVTPKLHSKISLKIQLQGDRLQTPLQDSTPRLHSILYTMPSKRPNL